MRYAGWWQAASIGLLGIYAVWTGEELGGQPLEITDNIDLYIYLASYSTLTCFFLVIGYFAYRGNRVWSIFILSVVIFEVGYKLITHPGKGIIVSIIVTLLAINGVRGSFALKRYMAESANAKEPTYS